MERHILTVDVEDNFTFEELSKKEDWIRYEGQVVENTSKILNILRTYKVTATFFVVGHVVERHPEIIKYILENGHEVASHSYWHKPLTNMTLDEIEKDIKKSKELLSSLIRGPVLGYRAMGFSIPVDSKSFYNILNNYGFKYDSSKKYGNSTVDSENTPYKVYPSKITLLGSNIIFSGGTYFRVLPLKVIEKGFMYYKKKDQPVMIYIHPWEFNKDQPKRKVSLKQNILQSPLSFNTEKKLVYLLKKYNFFSIKNYLDL